jgi:hypothetical protein
MSGIFDESEYASQADSVLDEVQSSTNGAAEENGILSEAIARIEEANLWRSLVSQEVFPPGSARDEIRNRANAKLKMIGMTEISELLGMSKKSPQAVAAELPFSNAEMENLKFLATLDSEQIRALHVLVNKVLKREQSVPAQPEYRPGVNLITPEPGPKVNSVSAAPSHAQAKVSTNKATSPKKPKAPKGQTRPVGAKPLPMVSADEQIMKGAIRASAPVLGGDQVANSMLSATIQQLTKGNILVDAGSASGEDDPNERF